MSSLEEDCRAWLNRMGGEFECHERLFIPISSRHCPRHRIASNACTFEDRWPCLAASIQASGIIDKAASVDMSIAVEGGRVRAKMVALTRCKVDERGS